MSGFSTYLAQKLIDHVLRGVTYTPPSGTYLALAVADLTDDNDTTKEVTGAWYARQEITSWAAPVGSGMSTSNSNALAYSAVTGSSLTVTHWGLYDALTSGNLLASGEFTTSKVGNVNNVFKVDAGEIELTFGGLLSVHLAQALINYVLRGQALSSPSKYVALFDADPTSSFVTANELDGAWYARQAVATWDAPVGTGNSTANTNGFTFPDVTGAEVTVTHWGLVDALTSGNLLFSSALTTSETLSIGDAFAAQAGDLTLSFV